MPDKFLDAPPKITTREMVEQARTEIGAVVAFGMHEIKDQIDRDHIKKAHELLCFALKESK